jgi:hypothetical protein
MHPVFGDAALREEKQGLEHVRFKRIHSVLAGVLKKRCGWMGHRRTLMTGRISWGRQLTFVAASADSVIKIPVIPHCAAATARASFIVARSAI